MTARWSSRAGGARGRAAARRRRCRTALRDAPRGDRGAEHVRDDREARVLRAAASATSTCWRQRAGDCEDAPDAVVAPADARAGARGAAGLRRGGRRGRAVRRRDERRRRRGAAARRLRRASSRSTWGGWTRGRGRRRSLTAVLEPGLPAAGGRRRAARRTGSRSATSRRATSGRRSAAAWRRARPARRRRATGASTSTCVGAALRDAGRRAGDAATLPGQRRRARRCASWWSARRARSA